MGLRAPHSPTGHVESGLLRNKLSFIEHTQMIHLVEKPFVFRVVHGLLRLVLLNTDSGETVHQLIDGESS